MEPRNRFQGMNSASLCSLAGRYDNPIPPRFLAPIDSLKIPALITGAGYAVVKDKCISNCSFDHALCTVAKFFWSFYHVWKVPVIELNYPGQYWYLKSDLYIQYMSNTPDNFSDHHSQEPFSVRIILNFVKQWFCKCELYPESMFGCVAA
jgi:hypothetical protein